MIQDAKGEVTVTNGGATILNQMVTEHRSIHDALCVIRCLVKKRFLILGRGAPETEVSRELMLHAVRS